MGKPFPRAFARVIMSGTTSSCSQAKSVPVRPIPVWTSSAIIRSPFSSQIRRIPWRYPGAGMTTPLSPWIGSTRTPQVFSVTAASSAGRSL